MKTLSSKYEMKQHLGLPQKVNPGSNVNTWTGYRHGQLVKAMWWDVVVVTCPKQSWVSSLREEVAIALNQVMMIIITIVGRVEFMNMIMMIH